MKPLINEGKIFIGKPPLYGVFKKNASQGTTKKQATKGRRQSKISSNILWAYTDAELEEILSANNLKSPRIVRYKGLGEMNPSTLWETTLDPETRTILRVQSEDNEESTNALQLLMGTDASTRYQLIRDNADGVELDI